MRCPPAYAILVAVSTLASGCSGSGAADSGPVSGAPRPSFDDSTGAVEGVVVDDAVQPVAGAQVGLVGTDFQTSTDPAGRFAINQIPPGPYTLAVAALGYESKGIKLEVTAGTSTSTRVVLTSLPAQEPYSTTVPLRGFWTLAADTLVAVPNSGVANSEHRFAFDADDGWNATVIELTWRFSNPAQSTTPGAWFNSQATAKGNTSSASMAEIFSKTSPIRAWLYPGEPYRNDQGQLQGRAYPTGAYHHNSFAFPLGMFSNETDPVTLGANAGRSRGFGVSINQPFSVYVTIFYFARAETTFSAIPDQ